ncbi:hypothetical protein AK812_SmicGene35602, partial [Symbiodinium microadriaticum]
DLAAARQLRDVAISAQKTAQDTLQFAQDTLQFVRTRWEEAAQAKDNEAAEKWEKKVERAEEKVERAEEKVETAEKKVDRAKVELDRAKHEVGKAIPAGRIKGMVKLRELRGHVSERVPSGTGKKAGGRLYCSKAGEPSKCFLSKEDSSEYYVEFAGSGPDDQGDGEAEEDSDHGFSFSDERSNAKFNFSPRQGGISSMATSAPSNAAPSVLGKGDRDPLDLEMQPLTGVNGNGEEKSPSHPGKQVWPSRNKFFCRGTMMTGLDLYPGSLLFVLHLGPVAQVFPHLWREGCYALPLATLADLLASDSGRRTKLAGGTDKSSCVVATDGAGVGQRNYHFFFGFVTSAVALESLVLCLAMMVLPVLFWFLNSENFELAVDGMIHVSSGALQPVFYALIALLGKVADGEETIVVLGSHIVCSSVLDSEVYHVFLIATKRTTKEFRRNLSNIAEERREALGSSILYCPQIHWALVDPRDVIRVDEAPPPTPNNFCTDELGGERSGWVCW